MTGENLAVGAIVAAVVGFIVVIFYYIGRSPEERRFLLPLAVASFGVKAALVPIYYTLLVATGWEGFAFFDSLAYHEHGIELAGEFRRGIDYSSEAWGAVDPGYPILTGIVYWLVGPNTLVIRMMNVTLSVLMLLYVYRIARLVFPEDARVAKYACYLTAFLPFSMAIVINHRKEPVVVLIAMFLVYHSIRLVRTERNWAMEIPLVLLGVVALSYFRSGYVYPFLGTVVICFFFAQRSIVRAVVLSIVSILVFAGVQLTLTDATSSSVEATSERFRGKLSLSAGHSQTGGLVRLVRITSPLDLYKLPAATALAAILPFPPDLAKPMPSQVLAFTNLFNLLFLPSMLYGAVVVLRKEDWNRRVPVIIFPFLYLVLVGLVNVGIVRYRETIFPVMLILAGVGLAQRGGGGVYAATYGSLALLGSLIYFVRL